MIPEHSLREVLQPHKFDIISVCNSGLNSVEEDVWFNLNSYVQSELLEISFISTESVSPGESSNEVYKIVTVDRTYYLTMYNYNNCTLDVDSVKITDSIEETYETLWRHPKYETLMLCKEI